MRIFTQTFKKGERYYNSITVRVERARKVSFLLALVLGVDVTSESKHNGDMDVYGF